MTIDRVREFCRALEGTTEDVKWGSDLAFSVGRKMYAVVCLDPPHTLAFKCTPESFAELVERDGVIPAPYLARAMWVQEQQMGATLDRHETEQLIATSYELVKAKLPKKVRLRPDATAAPQPNRKIRKVPVKAVRRTAPRSTRAPTRGRAASIRTRRKGR